jgi:putative lipoic acid-binding regulatory protein
VGWQRRSPAGVASEQAMIVLPPPYGAPIVAGSPAVADRAIVHAGQIRRMEVQERGPPITFETPRNKSSMASPIDNSSAKLEIAYPCRWPYTVIGRDETLVRAAIAEIVITLEHTVDLSRTSRTGKYCSLLLVATVDNEAHRNTIFATLREHRDITMVM